MKTIQFREWAFEVNTSLTKQKYNELKEINFDDEFEHHKLGYENFKLQRDSILSNELKDLFNEVGIDYRKPQFIYCPASNKGAVQEISYVFDFLGKLLSGKNTHIEGWCKEEMIAINEKEEIIFSKEGEGNQGLVDVNIDSITICIDTTIDWVLPPYHYEYPNKLLAEDLDLPF